MKFELRNLCCSYRRRNGPAQRALVSVNLKIASGECVGVIGSEGAGKSTLLQVMDTLLRPERGTLLLDDMDVWKDPRSLPVVRKQIGLCFQFSEQQFVCETVESELLLGSSPLPTGISQDVIKGALVELGLAPEKYLRRSPFSLSMGEARRLALASLLARGPRALLLDEPTAGLDGDGVDRVLGCLKRQREEGTTMVIVSHDLDLLAELVSRVVLLVEGIVRVDALASDILADEATLQQYGYDVPEIVRILEQLRARGEVLNQKLYGVEELRAILGTARS